MIVACILKNIKNQLWFQKVKIYLGWGMFRHAKMSKGLVDFLNFLNTAGGCVFNPHTFKNGLSKKTKTKKTISASKMTRKSTQPRVLCNSHYGNGVFAPFANGILLLSLLSKIRFANGANAPLP